MNKQEFTEALKEKLSQLPQGEIDKSLAFYEELIDDRMEDGATEDEAVAALGSMDEIVENVYMDQSIPTLVKAKVKEKNKNTENKVLWIVIMILTFPLWFPVAISVVCCFLSFYVSIWAVIISLYAAVLSCIVGGLGGIVSSIFLFVAGPVTRALMMLGMSLCCLAIGVLLAYPVFFLSKGLVKITVKFACFIKSLFISKKE